MDTDSTTLTSNSKTLKRSLVKRSTNNDSSRSRVSKVSLTGATLKGILKRKGNDTGGRKVLSMRKSAIKFSRIVSARLENEDPVDGGVRSTTSGNAIPTDARVSKAVIETTLLKSAAVLSDFTENTLPQTNSHINNFLAPEQFRISSLRQQRRNRPWSSGGVGLRPISPVVCSMVAERRKPDLSTLPPHIAELLKSDSETSVTSQEKEHTRKYHTRKMAIRQANTSNKVTTHTIPPLKTFDDSKAPDIIVVTASVRPRSKPMAPSEKANAPGTSSEIYRHEPSTDSENGTSGEDTSDSHSNSNSSSTPNKAKIPWGNVGLYAKSRKSPKLQLGIEKGVVFVLGPKTKAYSNTLGDPRELKALEDKPSSCKWVMNVGNFQDNELYFTSSEKGITVTGFRPPTLKYPEGQTVSRTVETPTNFDVKCLRIYRATNADDLLVLEEVEK